MQFLIVQIFLLLLASALAGVFFGWLQWRRGKASISAKKWKDAQNELKRLRRTLAEEPEYEEIASLRARLATLDSDNKALTKLVDEKSKPSARITDDLDLRSTSDSDRDDDTLTPAGVGGGSVAIDSDVRTEADLEATKTAVREKDAVIDRLRGELDAARQSEDELEELRQKARSSKDKDAEIEDLKHKLATVRSVLSNED